MLVRGVLTPRPPPTLVFRSAFLLVCAVYAAAVDADDSSATAAPAAAALTPEIFSDDDGNLHLEVPAGKMVTAQNSFTTVDSGDGDGDGKSVIHVLHKINKLKARLAALKNKLKSPDAVGLELGTRTIVNSWKSVSERLAHLLLRYG